MRFNSVNWRVSFFVIRTCSLPRDQHWPVIQMRWNTRSIWEMEHLFVVHPAGCHLKRWRKKRSVWLRCWPVVKLNLVTARGLHRSCWWRKKMEAPSFALTIADLMMRLSRTPILCPELMIPWTCWPVNNGSLLWMWRAVTGKFRCHRRPASRLRLPHILACFSHAISRSCHL